MDKILDRVENYWDNRSEGYCQTNIEELNSFKREAWIDIIKEYAPKVKERKLKALDIGTGPGFFAIVLDSLGYEVTAIDYTQAMLNKAKSNASIHNATINFKRMDAHILEFEDNTFDLVVSRNLTWNLQRPGEAYKEWHRVLTPKGRLLNFDANWYLHVHDPQKRKEYEQDRLNSINKKVNDHYTNTNTKEMEDIARQLPLSKEYRPEWDTKEFLKLGFNKIMIQREIGNRVWNEEEKINYGSTPMFMIGAEK